MVMVRGKGNMLCHVACKKLMLEISSTSLSVLRTWILKGMFEFTTIKFTRVVVFLDPSQVKYVHIVYDHILCMMMKVPIGTFG